MNIIKKIMGRLGMPVYRKSETSKVRHLVLKYCTGLGIDCGCGHDKIKKDAIGLDLPNPYTVMGTDKIDISCDLSKEKIPVPDNTYDYVYSSHLIEDFEDTGRILKEFIRVLKSDGNLILVFPDQYKYEQYCAIKREPPNPYHIHKNMRMGFMIDVLNNMGIKYRALFLSDCEIDYNCILVLQIFKPC